MQLIVLVRHGEKQSVSMSLFLVNHPLILQLSGNTV